MFKKNRLIALLDNRHKQANLFNGSSFSNFLSTPPKLPTNLPTQEPLALGKAGPVTPPTGVVGKVTGVGKGDNLPPNWKTPEELAQEQAQAQAYEKSIYNSVRFKPVPTAPRAFNPSEASLKSTSTNAVKTSPVLPNQPNVPTYMQGGRDKADAPSLDFEPYRNIDYSDIQPGPENEKARAIRRNQSMGRFGANFIPAYSKLSQTDRGKFMSGLSDKDFGIGEHPGSDTFSNYIDQGARFPRDSQGNYDVLRQGQRDDSLWLETKAHEAQRRNPGRLPVGQVPQYSDLQGTSEQIEAQIKQMQDQAVKMRDQGRAKWLEAYNNKLKAHWAGQGAAGGDIRGRDTSSFWGKLNPERAINAARAYARGDGMQSFEDSYKAFNGEGPLVGLEDKWNDPKWTDENIAKWTMADMTKSDEELAKTHPAYYDYRRSVIHPYEARLRQIANEKKKMSFAPQDEKSLPYNPVFQQHIIENYIPSFSILPPEAQEKAIARLDPKQAWNMAQALEAYQKTQAHQRDLKGDQNPNSVISTGPGWGGNADGLFSTIGKAQPKGIQAQDWNEAQNYGANKLQELLWKRLSSSDNYAHHSLAQLRNAYTQGNYPVQQPNQYDDKYYKDAIFNFTGTNPADQSPAAKLNRLRQLYQKTSTSEQRAQQLGSIHPKLVGDYSGTAGQLLDLEASGKIVPNSPEDYALQDINGMLKKKYGPDHRLKNDWTDSTKGLDVNGRMEQLPKPVFDIWQKLKFGGVPSETDKLIINRIENGQFDPKQFQADELLRKQHNESPSAIRGNGFLKQLQDQYGQPAVDQEVNKFRTQQGELLLAQAQEEAKKHIQDYTPGTDVNKIYEDKIRAQYPHIFSSGPDKFKYFKPQLLADEDTQTSSWIWQPTDEMRDLQLMQSLAAGTGFVKADTSGWDPKKIYDEGIKGRGDPFQPLGSQYGAAPIPWTKPGAYNYQGHGVEHGPHQLPFSTPQQSSMWHQLYGMKTPEEIVKENLQKPRTQYFTNQPQGYQPGIADSMAIQKNPWIDNQALRDTPVLGKIPFLSRRGNLLDAYELMGAAAMGGSTAPEMLDSTLHAGMVASPLGSETSEQVYKATGSEGLAMLAGMGVGLGSMKFNPRLGQRASNALSKRIFSEPPPLQQSVGGAKFDALHTGKRMAKEMAPNMPKLQAELHPGLSKGVLKEMLPESQAPKFFHETPTGKLNTALTSKAMLGGEEVLDPTTRIRPDQSMYRHTQVENEPAIDPTTRQQKVDSSGKPLYRDINGQETIIPHRFEIPNFTSPSAWFGSPKAWWKNLDASDPMTAIPQGVRDQLYNLGQKIRTAPGRLADVAEQESFRNHPYRRTGAAAVDPLGEAPRGIGNAAREMYGKDSWIPYLLEHGSNTALMPARFATGGPLWRELALHGISRGNIARLTPLGLGGMVLGALTGKEMGSSLYRSTGGPFIEYPRLANPPSDKTRQQLLQEDYLQQYEQPLALGDRISKAVQSGKLERVPPELWNFGANAVQQQKDIYSGLMQGNDINDPTGRKKALEELKNYPQYHDHAVTPEGEVGRRVAKIRAEMEMKGTTSAEMDTDYTTSLDKFNEQRFGMRDKFNTAHPLLGHREDIDPKVAKKYADLAQEKMLSLEEVKLQGLQNRISKSFRNYQTALSQKDTNSAQTALAEFNKSKADYFKIQQTHMDAYKQQQANPGSYKPHQALNPIEDPVQQKLAPAQLESLQQDVALAQSQKAKILQAAGYDQSKLDSMFYDNPELQQQYDRSSKALNNAYLRLAMHDPQAAMENPISQNVADWKPLPASSDPRALIGDPVQSQLATGLLKEQPPTTPVATQLAENVPLPGQQPVKTAPTPVYDPSAGLISPFPKSRGAPDENVQPKAVTTPQPPTIQPPTAPPGVGKQAPQPPVSPASSLQQINSALDAKINSGGPDAQQSKVLKYHVNKAGSTAMQQLTQAGVDVNDPKAVNSFFQQPQVKEQIAQKLLHDPEFQKDFGDLDPADALHVSLGVWDRLQDHHKMMVYGGLTLGALGILSSLFSSDDEDDEDPKHQKSHSMSLLGPLLGLGGAGLAGYGLSGGKPSQLLQPKFWNNAKTQAVKWSNGLGSLLHK